MTAPLISHAPAGRRLKRPSSAPSARWRRCWSPTPGAGRGPRDRRRRGPGRSLVSLGYDRDFTSLSRPGPPHPAGAAELAGLPAAGWRLAGLDRARRTARIPAGVLLDLGATAKRFAADRAADRIATAVGCGVPSTWAVTSGWPDRPRTAAGASASPAAWARGGFHRSAPGHRPAHRRGIRRHAHRGPVTGRRRRGHPGFGPPFDAVEPGRRHRRVRPQLIRHRPPASLPGARG
jgi:hypothetical protein